MFFAGLRTGRPGSGRSPFKSGLDGRNVGVISVTGGSFQSKRVFVRQYLGKQSADGAVWTEGAETSWEGFMDGRFCRDFQLFVRRAMEGSASPSFREQKGPAMDQILEQLLEELLVGSKDHVLVADRIGCGIVPAGAFECLHREETGRLYCRIAGEADGV